MMQERLNTPSDGGGNPATGTDGAEREQQDSEENTRFSGDTYGPTLMR